MIIAKIVKSSAFALAASVAVANAAHALEMKSYDAAAFEAAQEAGQAVLIDVHAPWCPTCKAQQKVLDSIKAKPELAKVTVFKVDFDSQTNALTALKVKSQSTLIAFKGATETGRSTGDTDVKKIEALIGTALK